jgi:hypothetical protein
MAGESSLAAWIETLLEDRQCLDCEREIAGLEGTLEFRGIPPHVECIGSLCPRCSGQCEEIRRLATQKLSHHWEESCATLCSPSCSCFA